MVLASQASSVDQLLAALLLLGLGNALQGLCQGDDIPLAARIDPTTPLAKVLFPWLPAPTLKAGQDRTPPPSTPPVDFGFFL
jgi:hypothetical protein